MTGTPKNKPLKLASYANNGLLKSDSLFRQGVTLFSQGQFASAKTVLEQVLHIQSNHLDAMNVLGIIAIQTKEFHTALGFFDKATRLAPTNPAFFGNRGNVHKELKHWDQAISDYTKAIKLKPDYAMAYLNQGIVYSELKQFDLALKSLDQAIMFKTADENAYCQRGVVLMELQRYEEAATNFEQAIKLKPNFSTAYSNRGNALKELNKYQQALSDYDKAIAIKPDYAEAYANRGLVLQQLNLTDEALSSLEQAIKLNPDYAAAYLNRGLILQGIGLTGEALSSFDQAINLKHDYVAAYRNKALALLVTGEFKQGWALYDWRWKFEKLNLKLFKTDKPKALSLGTEPHQNILVWGEQGVGDQILYAGMLDELFKTVPSAQVLLDKRLLPLFQRSMPHGIFKDIKTPSEDVEFDAHLPIADLGSFFRVSPEDFDKTKTSYLIADAERAKDIRSELIGQKKYVCGISWSSHTVKIGAAKSVQLTDLLPLLSKQDIAFVSLQYGEVSQELAAFNRQHGVTIQECASVDNFNDLDDHAALIEACDFVVTISNTSAHMAGALGKQTYLLFSMGQGALWYWSNQIDGQSMWYPNLCIYQQTIPGQWADCVDTVCKDIEKNT